MAGQGRRRLFESVSEPEIVDVHPRSRELGMEVAPTKPGPELPPQDGLPDDARRRARIVRNDLVEVGWRGGMERRLDGGEGDHNGRHRQAQVHDEPTREGIPRAGPRQGEEQCGVDGCRRDEAEHPSGEHRPAQ